MEERTCQKLIVSHFCLLWNQNFITTYTSFQLLYSILSHTKAVHTRIFYIFISKSFPIQA
jgi:hypothetical protein